MLILLLLSMTNSPKKRSDSQICQAPLKIYLCFKTVEIHCFVLPPLYLFLRKLES